MTNKKYEDFFKQWAQGLHNVMPVGITDRNIKFTFPFPFANRNIKID